MASPFVTVWNLLKPALTDVVSTFAGVGGLDQGDKAVIGGNPSPTQGILGTLTPYFGNRSVVSVSTAWRDNQLEDDAWITQNAYATTATYGSGFNYDDTTKAALAFTKETSGPYFRWMSAVSGSNPVSWTERARLSATGFSLGSPALLSTASTTGFPYLPSMANTPTGLPTTLTGLSPLVIDLTTPAIWFAPVTGTGTAWKQVGSVPTITLKNGSGVGTYQTTNTTYTDVDATNLALTTVIPAGQKLMISSVGSMAVLTSAVNVLVALFDGTTTLTEQQLLPTNTSQSVGFAIASVVTGDGASHTIKLRYRTSTAGDAVQIINGNATTAPAMTFWQGVSN